MCFYMFGIYIVVCMCVCARVAGVLGVLVKDVLQ